MSPSDNTRVWLITGTSTGFGRRAASIALSRGDRVIATARSLDKLDDLRSSADDHADRLHLLQLDVTSGSAAIKEVIDAAAAHWGRIDVLVNNAGYGIPGLLEEGGTERLRLQFETNVFGLMDVTFATLPYMRAQKSGTVVNIGSRSAWRTDRPGLGPYSSSKAAVHALSETLATEVAQFNIRVLLVAPGAFRTEGIYGQQYYTGNPIADYEPLRSASIKALKSVPGSEKGDPDKAMEALVDVVRGEGIAKGREWPGHLVLGEDAEADIRNKAETVIEVLNAWSDVAKGSLMHSRLHFSNLKYGLSSSILAESIKSPNCDWLIATSPRHQ
ncbi:hypothetical protein HGRIS_014269 [Hohenbuehelia grisea]|uniref:NAD(P)-binding protein n=1 Tax=Hohenbuehelia grisea TaxID=104357 RepID=A0ABR3JTV5_9AGAR